MLFGGQERFLAGGKFEPVLQVGQTPSMKMYTSIRGATGPDSRWLRLSQELPGPSTALNSCLRGQPAPFWPSATATASDLLHLVFGLALIAKACKAAPRPPL